MAEKKEKQYVGDNAQLMSEWDWEQNLKCGLDPKVLTVGTGRKAWWKCAKEHHWEAAVSSRVRGSGCPVCANQQVLVGYNDFPTAFPELLCEWDYDRNQGIDPYDYTAGSEQYAWWKCRKGHSWKTMICSRTQGYGCPACAKEYKTSIPEQAVFYYCKQFAADAINTYQPEWLGKAEIDIFLPSLKIGIEYDGRVWHKNIEKDMAKDALCAENGIRLFRIREPGILCYSDDCVGLSSLSQDALSKGILEVFQKIGIMNIAVDVSQDINEIYQLMEFKEKQYSLANQNPEVAKEWARDQEQGLPSEYHFGSNRKVWWRCAKGHSWMASIQQRVRTGSGCPYCAGQKAVPGETDVATIDPELISEWDYGKNTEIHPEELLPHSRAEVWWRCSQGHSWKASVRNRFISKNRKCPMCRTGRKKTSEP